MWDDLDEHVATLVEQDYEIVIPRTEGILDVYSHVRALSSNYVKIARIRARTFAPDWGVPEEEANGSGSMQLAHKLGRNLEILHGKGSIIRASVGSSGIAIGGLVRQDPKISIKYLQPLHMSAQTLSFNASTIRDLW
jgi:hypothetical protein